MTVLSSITDRSTEIARELGNDQILGRFVDSTLPVPQPFIGTGEIRLLVLGQDPTVKNAQSRRDIRIVLNLDKNRSVRSYLAGVCNDLGIDIIENVYATNLYKNFFRDPPTQIEEINVFDEFLQAWLPLLKDELASFDNIPVISLGEPILGTIVNSGVSNRVREYWGHTPQWKAGEMLPFQFSRPDENKLGRIVYPYPHQPSIRKEFYREKMKDYTAYVKSISFS